jgi:hypothetical protein
MALVDLTKPQCFCANCHRRIGELEQAYIYSGNPVCRQCYGVLQPPPAPASTPAPHRPAANRLAPLQWTMFALFVLFSFVGVATAANGEGSGFVAAWVFCIGWIGSLIAGWLLKGE